MDVMKKCKCCLSPLRKDIDELLLKDYSYQYIHKYCSDRGLMVSNTGVRRHAVSHVPGYKDPKVSPLDPDNPAYTLNSKCIAEEAIPNPTLIDPAQLRSMLALPIEITDYDGLLNEIKTVMLKIYSNQLYIVLGKQEAYMRGEGKNPADDIRSLRMLANLISEVPGYVEALRSESSKQLDEMVDEN